VAYLVRAGATRLLFDTGLSGGQAGSALVTNAGGSGSTCPPWTRW
jgi:hypothetical protein